MPWCLRDDKVLMAAAVYSDSVLCAWGRRRQDNIFDHGVQDMNMWQNLPTEETSRECQFTGTTFPNF